MGDVKPWQIVVIVAAVVVAVSSFLIFGRGERLDLDNSVRMVDVGTGEVFSLKLGRPEAMIPGQNPKTKEWTLMPVEQHEDGKLYVSERYLAAVKNIPGEHGAIDASTGQVKER
jgi:hypothetical protein